MVNRSPLQRLYNTLLRPFLPQKLAVYNGVPIRAVKLFDRKVTFPQYEEALIGGIRKHGEPGDTIVQVGGGRGPSAVAAARRVEPTGHVVVYEGGHEYVKKIRETLKLNNVSGLVSVQELIVGEARDVWGDTTAAQVVEPESLPECDLLVLDCEGAEQTILANLEIEPETIIVESHGELESPTHMVKKKVSRLGYEIESIAPEVPEEDVYVVVAHRSK